MAGAAVAGAAGELADAVEDKFNDLSSCRSLPQTNSCDGGARTGYSLSV